MNYEDFRAPARLNDAYLPSPIKKSASILKLQQKWAAKDAEKPVKRNFSSYRDIEKPPFEVLDAAAVKPNIAGLESTGQGKSYRSIDSPNSVIPRPIVNKVRFASGESSPGVAPHHHGVTSGVDSVPLSLTLKGENSVKEEKLVSSEARKEAKISFLTRSYKRWEFGKRKLFERPLDNAETNKAAVTIQRIGRGGMQRIHYKIERCEWLLRTREERTKADLIQVQEQFDQKKKVFRAKVQEDAKKESRRLQQTCKTAEESQKIIAYLRKENKKMREKNQKVYDAIVNLKQQNARLEGANEVTDGTINTLTDHAKVVEETHAKLMDVIPKYQESISALSEAVQTRRQFGEAEHKIRLLYVTLLGEIVERLEESRTEQAMAEEVVQQMLELEETELAKLRILNPDEKMNSNCRALEMPEDESEDDSLDAYTVHTLDD